MKELTIEQKAKAYDEAVENMRKFRDALNNHEELDLWVLKKEIVKDIEYYFPELKESEDERVRKKIIEYMKTGTYNKDYIRYADRYSHEIWRKLMDNFKNIKDYHIGCNEVSDIVLNAIIDTFNWLEKGGDKNKVSKHVEAINEEKVDDANKVEPKDYNSIDPHFGKPADKVEPKFKVKKGKWYVCTDTFVSRGKIIAIKGQTYQSKQEDDTITCEDNCLFIDRHDGKASDYFRPWTIQDAKDGDVLAISWWEDNNFWEKIIIFKKYHNKGVKGLYCMPCVEGYGNTFKNGKLAFNEKVPYYSKTWTCNLHPATKEQRDKLFEKMHEAEYVWDTEKKELKKIEESENIKNQIMSEITDLVKDYITQKPARCSEEDELSCFESALFTAFSDAWQSYLLGEEVNVKQWTKEHSKELLEAAKEELKGHNSAWSEEDEKMVNDIIAAIDTLHYHGMVKWLKSLKQRMNNV